jgi:hypothetical protein
MSRPWRTYFDNDDITGKSRFPKVWVPKANTMVVACLLTLALSPPLK